MAEARTGEASADRRHDNRAWPPTPRTLRVNQVLREVVADELERLADADDRLRLVTVTSVETAPDLRQATVYLSSLSDDAADALEPSDGSSSSGRSAARCG